MSRYIGHVGGVDNIRDALLCVGIECDLDVEKLHNEITHVHRTRGL